MTKKSSVGASLADIFKPAQGALALNPMFGPMLKQFWSAQDKLLEESETYAVHWFSRRHKATREALDVVRLATSDGISDPAVTISALADWQRHSAERMADDMREYVEFAARCTAHVVGAEMEAGEESLTKATRQAKSLTKTRGAVPV